MNFSKQNHQFFKFKRFVESHPLLSESCVYKKKPMEGCPRNREICPKLLDLIPQESKWYHEEKINTDQEKKLELRLGPPGVDEEDRSAMNMKKNTETRNIKKESEDKSILSLTGNHFSLTNKTTDAPHISQKRYLHIYSL